jgi:5-methyltetrahydropteroyltriglutamate--homocysteine methyltransferase
MVWRFIDHRAGEVPPSATHASTAGGEDRRTASTREVGETMRSSRDRILTSHAGSLPRPDALIEANRTRGSGEGPVEAQFQAQLRSAVTEVVRRQQALGIDLPGDGEFGKSMGHRVNYGAWWSYSFQRLGGLELSGPGLYAMPVHRSRPGEVVLTSFGDRRDRTRFAAAYNDPESGITTGPRAPNWPVCVGPLVYTGHAAIKADIDNFKAALAACGIEEGFMTSVAPGSASRIGNSYYKTEDEFLFACADAMREEYKAIIDGGLILQLDDPSIAENWDQINPEPTVKDYQAFSMRRVEALNHAIRGLPEDRIRFHLCWGSWHGPHTTDIPMRDIVDVMLSINAGAYSFEAGNVRHEHEWSVWRDVKLPDGKLILPGVVSHATNVVEHPELVAERIGRFANLVGRERVIAATDCGLGGRVHPDIAWAKLEALAQGAELASRQLWGQPKAA